MLHSHPSPFNAPILVSSLYLYDNILYFSFLGYNTKGFWKSHMETYYCRSFLESPYSGGDNSPTNNFPINWSYEVKHQVPGKGYILLSLTRGGSYTSEYHRLLSIEMVTLHTLMVRPNAKDVTSLQCRTRINQAGAQLEASRCQLAFAVFQEGLLPHHWRRNSITNITQLQTPVTHNSDLPARDTGAVVL